MNYKDKETAERVKQVYQALKTDETFKIFSDAKLMDHALKIVMTTNIESVENSLKYIS